MVTRRTDARRRRVLSEEFVPTDQDAVTGCRKPMQAYSYGANRRNQPKTTDLIPKRAVSLGLFFLLVATIVAALNVLASVFTPTESLIGAVGSQAFALSGAGSLANWFCSVSLFLCSGICVQLFYLRRHKRDDYGGMYYVWLVMAGMFLVASIDCAIDLRTICAKLFETATQRSLLQPPWLIMTIELIVLAVVVIRMLFEVRTSRFSLAAVLLVWLGFVGCVVLRHSDVASSVQWIDQKVAYGNCALLGCVGALVALVVYTRFVFLHAHGLIQLKVGLTQETASEEQPVKTKPKKSARKKKEPTPQISLAATPDQEPVTTKTTRTKPKPAATQKEKAKPTSSLRSRLTKKSAKTTRTEPATVQPPAPQPVSPRLTRKKPTTKTAVQRNPERTTERSPQPAAPAPATVTSTEKVAANEPDNADLQQELEEIESVSMSKSERRRLRKLAKRAARAKKAA